ncbi:MAG: class I SAM-dependent methyltransferase, partial [Bacteroidota bacterium]
MNYQIPLITEAHKDPFGLAMWSYMRGNLKAKVKVYSDIAVDDNIPVSYLFRTYSQMPKWEQKAIDHCYGYILDIGAGAGSHSLELQNRGEEVKAIDISYGAVEMMKERGLKQASHISFWDLAEESFDTLLLMMNGIGLVGNLKGLNAFLEKAKTHLNAGAQIILDSSDINYLYEELEMRPPKDTYYG